MVATSSLTRSVDPSLDPKLGSPVLLPLPPLSPFSCRSAFASMFMLLPNDNYIDINTDGGGCHDIYDEDGGRLATNLLGGSQSSPKVGAVGALITTPVAACPMSLYIYAITILVVDAAVATTICIDTDALTAQQLYLRQCRCKAAKGGQQRGFGRSSCDPSYVSRLGFAQWVSGEATTIFVVDIAMTHWTNPSLNPKLGLLELLMPASTSTLMQIPLGNEGRIPSSTQSWGRRSSYCSSLLLASTSTLM
ncbi:hypothetical protein BHE74_00032013 [Ensete ventricosum]|nr:hypothetical protein BHE74_00032013 [Ensete ventricosum]